MTGNEMVSKALRIHQDYTNSTPANVVLLLLFKHNAMKNDWLLRLISHRAPPAANSGNEVAGVWNRRWHPKNANAGLS